VLTLLLVGASLLVSLLEQVRERRRDARGVRLERGRGAVRRRRGGRLGRDRAQPACAVARDAADGLRTE
jgi:hypothetical protein